MQYKCPNCNYESNGKTEICPNCGYSNNSILSQINENNKSKNKKVTLIIIM